MSQANKDFMVALTVAAAVLAGLIILVVTR